MKIYAISDLHLSINSNKPMNIFGPAWDNYIEEIRESWEQVAEEDIVLISGDLSWAMKLEDAVPDIEYIAGLGKGRKVVIKGNHDYWWSSISKLRNLLPVGMYALQNDAVKFGEYIICGTRGWTVPEQSHKTSDDEKIYNREVLRLELSLQEAKRLQTNNEKIIVMMHYPPFNSKLEDSDFTKLLEKYEISTVVYGHLHSYDKKQQLIACKNDIKYYLTSCDLIGNKLIEIK
ncbi:MAG: metallophosphoesterase [Clostridia bacterium]|nr:metallophosphoesterase [Clostridia bacterium]MBR4003030.1 metallophosphoesterase [Clostridia bacterium]